MAIELSEIIERLELADMECACYYDRQRDEFLDVFDGMVNAIHNLEWIEEIEANETGNYVSLPDPFDINKYQMMQNFVTSLPFGDKQSSLCRAINGRGAFRRFKNKIYQFGLEKEWYQFRDKCYEKIAREWCQENNIPLIED